MKITTLDKDVKGVLSSHYYKIPRFQRPYSWLREHIDDYWNDTVVEVEEDYFIGSMVVYVAGDDVCAGDLVLGSRLNIGGSSACVFYVAGGGIYSGTLGITFADTTCVCGSRRLRVPVGTNCY